MTVSTPALAEVDVVFAGVDVRLGERTVLSGIDLRIARGQRVALIGPSGAGKTTLLRLCGGVLWPTRGSVRVLGHEIGALRGSRLRSLRRQVGFLHQGDNLVPSLRVAHNVLMGRLGRWSLLRALWSLLRPQELPRAEAALAAVELGDRLWAMPGELSGGEQQRVAIARLLLQEPTLLLADEPVSALDLRLGREVVRLLLDVAAKGRTTLVSLHSLELLTHGFDRVVALREGRLAFDGAPQALSRALLQEVYGAEYRTLHFDDLELPTAPG